MVSGLVFSLLELHLYLRLFHCPPYILWSMMHITYGIIVQDSQLKDLIMGDEHVSNAYLFYYLGGNRYIILHLLDNIHPHTLDPSSVPIIGIVYMYFRLTK